MNLLALVQALNNEADKHKAFAEEADTGPALTVASTAAMILYSLANALAITLKETSNTLDGDGE